jgi:hypothetical protein
MRLSGTFALAFGLALAAAVPQIVAAQQNRGPEFCRNGQGHPRFGREWCIDHGFPLGNQWSQTYQQQQAARAQAERQRAWEQRNDWNDVTMTSPRQQSIARVGSTQLAQIVGANGLRRLQQQAQSLGMTRPLLGSWMRDTNGHAVLLVTSGGSQIAQIVDTNGDGQVDRVFLMHP